MEVVGPRRRSLRGLRGVEHRQAVDAAALDELVRAGIVRPTGVPGRLQFRHPITRRAVYETTGRGWRLRAHRRAAQGLARRGAPVGAQAQHVARSAPSAGDEAALSLLVAAGELASPRAPAAAAHWLEAAVRLLPAEATLERGPAGTAGQGHGHGRTAPGQQGRPAAGASSGAAG